MVTYPYISPLAFERLTVLTQAIKYSLAESLVRIINPRFVPAFDRDAIRVSLLGLHYERFGWYDETAHISDENWDRLRARVDTAQRRGKSFVASTPSGGCQLVDKLEGNFEPDQGF